MTQSASDNGQLIPMPEQVEQNTGRLPQEALADAGYGAEENLVCLALNLRRLAGQMARA